MPDEFVFNPLDKRVLGDSIVKALIETAAHDLEALHPFKGAGVYAIYYHGDFKPYAPLSVENSDRSSFPIYVGKATPSGGQKGLKVDLSRDSTKLYSRLKEHRESINAVDSLAISHFTYRCLVVDDVWIGLGESLLIQKYEPLWNQIVMGFGNHAPGGGRGKGKKPLWDELHPGREWAKDLEPPKYNRQDILSQVRSYMRSRFGEA